LNFIPRFVCFNPPRLGGPRLSCPTFHLPVTRPLEPKNPHFPTTPPKTTHSFSTLFAVSAQTRTSSPKKGLPPATAVQRHFSFSRPITPLLSFTKPTRASPRRPRTVTRPDVPRSGAANLTPFHFGPSPHFLSSLFCYSVKFPASLYRDPTSFFLEPIPLSPGGPKISKNIVSWFPPCSLTRLSLYIVSLFTWSPRDRKPGGFPRSGYFFPV